MNAGAGAFPRSPSCEYQGCGLAPALLGRRTYWRPWRETPPAARRWTTTARRSPRTAVSAPAGGCAPAAVRSARRRRRAPPRRRVPPTAHRRGWGRTPQGSSRLPVACQRRFWGIPRVQPRTLVLLAPPSYAKGRLCAGPKRCGDAGGVAGCARSIGLGRECCPPGRHPAERLAAGIAPGGVQLGYVAIEELAYLRLGAVPAELIFELVDYSVVYDAAI